MIIGAYIGGVSNNHGELNPASWNWKDEWTYISMFVGGATGALGGYGIMNPGTVGLSLGASSPYVAAGITATSGAAVLGQGTNWNFDLHWSTVAGGGGQIGLNGNPPSAEQIVNQEIAIVNQVYGKAWRAASYGEIRPFQPSAWDSWFDKSQNNMLLKITYDLTDGIWVTAQALFIGPNASHINGSEVIGNDRVDAFLNTTEWGIGYTITPLKIAKFSSGPASGYILRNELGNSLMYINRGKKSARYGYQYSFKWNKKPLRKWKESWIHIFDW